MLVRYRLKNFLKKVFTAIGILVYKYVSIYYMVCLIWNIGSIGLVRFERLRGSPSYENLTGSIRSVSSKYLGYTLFLFFPFYFIFFLFFFFLYHTLLSLPFLASDVKCTEDKLLHVDVGREGKEGYLSMSLALTKGSTSNTHVIYIHLEWLSQDINPAISHYKATLHHSISSLPKRRIIAKLSKKLNLINIKSVDF